jgi:hypothetical protein
MLTRHATYTILAADKDPLIYVWIDAGNKN